MDGRLALTRGRDRQNGDLGVDFSSALEEEEHPIQAPGDDQRVMVPPMLIATNQEDSG